MTRLDRCLSQIQAIRSVAAGVEPAYVARSRIGRLTLSGAVLVAKETGIPAPSLPSAIPFPETGSSCLRWVASCCNHIATLGKHLAQPSEPLDDRWRRGWSELLGELRALETHLIALRDERGGEQSGT